MGHIGQEICVLPPYNLKLLRNFFISLPRLQPSVDPIPGNRRSADCHHASNHQPYHILYSYIGRKCVQDKNMIQKLKRIQRHRHIHQTLAVQHGKDKNHDADHGRKVKETLCMHPEKEKLKHYHSGTQILIMRLRTDLSDVKAPHAEHGKHNQRNHPYLPRHGHRNQSQHHAEHADNAGQKQIFARLPLRPHYSSNSFATRFKSSCGWNGFFR